MTVDRDRLVEWALRAVSTPSFTGQEEAMGRLMQKTFEGMGLQTQWQQVEEGRANALDLVHVVASGLRCGYGACTPCG